MNNSGLFEWWRGASPTRACPRSNVHSNGDGHGDGHGDLPGIAPRLPCTIITDPGPLLPP